MIVDKKTVALFEDEQRQYGTEVAIKNLVFLIADGLLKDIGAKKVSVTYHKDHR